MDAPEYPQIASYIIICENLSLNIQSDMILLDIDCLKINKIKFMLTKVAESRAKWLIYELKHKIKFKK